MTPRKRFFKIAFIIFKILLDFRKEYNLAKRRGYKYAQQKMKARHLKRAEELYETAVSLEGAVIKVCQYFSAQPNIFPTPYIKTLSELQDDVPPVDFEKIGIILREQYGDYKNHFKRIDAEPIASASLSQIHRGILHNGREVVLKILRPGIETIIDTDFAIFSLVFQIIANTPILMQRNDLVNALSNMLDDFYRITGDELDYMREVYMATQFRQTMKKYPYVIIPYIYSEYCTKKTIVMEFVNGNKIYDTFLWHKRNNDPELIAKRLIEVYVHQLLFSRIVHYDPHPGNILIMENSGFALLDFGMTGEITDEMRQGLFRILIAGVAKDFKQVIDILDDLGFIRKRSEKYALLPIIEFFYREAINMVRIERQAIFELDISPIRDNIVNIVSAQIINLPPNWAYLGKTVTSLLGILTTLNPDFNFYEEIKYAILRMLKNHFPSLFSQLSVMLFSSFSENLVTLVTLPVKMNRFINNLENGDLKLKTDYSEAIGEINSLKEFIVRFTFLIISLLSASGSYILNIKQDDELSFLCLIVSSLSMIIALLFRKRTHDSSTHDKIQNSGLPLKY